MDDIQEYFEKDVFTEKKDALEKAGRYYKNLCGEHGRIEKGSITLKMILDGSGRGTLSGRALQVLAHVYLQ